MTKVRIIGDIHGNYDDYLQLIKNQKYSIQLGDFGFDYSVLDKINPANHRIVPGNHDNYDKIGEYPHFLQHDYGFFELGGVEFFYIRGAHSIDRQYRVEGISWWPQEQISYKSGQTLLKNILEWRPKMILSHDCPSQFLKLIFKEKYHQYPSMTHELLTQLFELWQPKYWFCGHYHTNLSAIINKTFFFCINSSGYIDYVDR